MEMLKAPFRAAVAGRIASWLGPIAGALVSVISLRRMNCPAQANRVFVLTLLAAIVLSTVLLLTPDALGRLIGFAAEIAFWLIFPRIQHQQFEDWQSAHPDAQPSNGWLAIGWGFAGLLLFLLITMLVGFILAMFIPGVSR
jgi:hypothetical protein